MISLEEAKQRVFPNVATRPPVEVPIREALHLVTAEPVVSSEAVPPFDNTAVDGFALIAEETVDAPLRLRIVGEIAAGRSSDRRVESGEAVRIMTGAPIPPGATGVVMVEDTEVEDDEVIVKVAVGTGESIRLRASDVTPGTVVLAAGTVLSPAHLGVLASIGCSTVSVYPGPRVGVISTGDELVTDGSPLRPGQIRESNSELLVGLLHEADCEPVDYGVIPDNEEQLTAALLRAAGECDALLTSGGVSMGDYDLVKALLGKLGEMDWMQIAIRPAKPFAFGRLKSTTSSIPVFGLPGNPVSSLVSFELFARPSLRKMMGYGVTERPVVDAIADGGLRRPQGDGKTHLIRVRLEFGDDGRLHASPTGAQGSHQLANSAAANGLALVVDGPGIAPGGAVPVMCFTGPGVSRHL